MHCVIRPGGTCASPARPRPSGYGGSGVRNGSGAESTSRNRPPRTNRRHADADDALGVTGPPAGGGFPGRRTVSTAATPGPRRAARTRRRCRPVRQGWPRVPGAAKPLCRPHAALSFRCCPPTTRAPVPSTPATEPPSPALSAQASPTAAATPVAAMTTRHHLHTSSRSRPMSARKACRWSTSVIAPLALRQSMPGVSPAL